MKTGIVMLLVLSCSSAARAQSSESSVEPLLTVRGRLLANGAKLATDARFSLHPETHNSTEVVLGDDARFELKALTARRYSMRIDATGYAPVTKLLEIQPGGTVDVGTVKLFTFKRIFLNVVIGSKKKIETVAATGVTMVANACVSLRANDTSGCFVRLCASQDGDVVSIISDNGAEIRPQGKTTLKDALAGNAPIVNTFGSGPDVPLIVGEVSTLEFTDPFCGGALRVEREEPPAQ
jgi:hypothetical protein